VRNLTIVPCVLAALLMAACSGANAPSASGILPAITPSTASSTGAPSIVRRHPPSCCASSIAPQKLGKANTLDVKTDTLNVVIANAASSTDLTFHFLVNGTTNQFVKTAPDQTFSFTKTTKGCTPVGPNLICHEPLPIVTAPTILDIEAGGSSNPQFVMFPSGRSVNLAFEPSEYVASHTASGLAPSASGAWKNHGGTVFFKGRGYVIFNEVDSLGYTIVGPGAARAYSIALVQTTTGWSMASSSGVPGGTYPPNFALITPPAHSTNVNTLDVYPVYGATRCTVCGYVARIAAATP
jgi:hypothetical protein